MSKQMFSTLVITIHHFMLVQRFLSGGVFARRRNAIETGNNLLIVCFSANVFRAKINFFWPKHESTLIGFNRGEKSRNMVIHIWEETSKQLCFRETIRHFVFANL